MTRLNHNALRILAAIACHPTPRTYRKLAREVGISHNAVQSHLLRLRRLGLVTWDRGACGSLRLTCRWEDA